MLLPEAQRITDRGGQFDQISVAAADGVTPEQLRDRIARSCRARCRWRPASRRRSGRRTTSRSDLGFLRIALLVFAGVSLFVGAFQIFNTFSITVAQRTREFGMLRTLGASRRQILASVGLEALALGVLGAVAGSPAASGSRSAINALFKAVGIDLPNTGTVIETRTVIVSLIVGVVVTLAGGAGAGAARHARHADGGAARGRAAGHEEARPGRDAPSRSCSAWSASR